MNTVLRDVPPVPTGPNSKPRPWIDLGLGGILNGVKEGVSPSDKWLAVEGVSQGMGDSKKPSYSLGLDGNSLMTHHDYDWDLAFLILGQLFWVSFWVWSSLFTFGAFSAMVSP